MAEASHKLFKSMKDKGLNTKFVRMDNAGDNKLLEQKTKSKDWQSGWHVEYTLRDTWQRNPLADLEFATIGNKGRALLVCA